jgi:BASS family bile acid:Na+ symporter
MSIGPLIDVTIPVIAFLSLMAVGMDLTVVHFDRVRRQLVILVTGLLVPLFTLPLLAVGLIELLNPAPHIAAGLLLVASCPIGGLSNVFTYLAGASAALSIALTTLSSMLAFATIPALSWALGMVLGRPLGFAAPAILPLQLAVMIVLPVLIGMGVRHRWPDVATTHRSSIQRVAFVLLGLLMALIIASDTALFVAGLADTVPLAFLFILASFATGWLAASMAGASSPDRFTLAVEFAARNIIIATAIAVTLLGQTSFAIFGNTYALVELPTLLVAAWAYRVIDRPVQAR